MSQQPDSERHKMILEKFARVVSVDKVGEILHPGLIAVQLQMLAKTKDGYIDISEEGFSYAVTREYLMNTEKVEKLGLEKGSIVAIALLGLGPIKVIQEKQKPPTLAHAA